MAILRADIAVAWTALLAIAAAAPASGATVTAVAKAKVVKPLAIRSIQDLELGTLILAPGSWSGAVVRLSRAGALTCPATIACTGATQVAIYNVSGSNSQAVRINTPNVSLVNQADPTKTVTLVIEGPGTVTLTNSGNPGTNFPLGGSITVDSTTAGGDYSGTFQVTAEYQ